MTFEINKIELELNGNPNGILLLNKPIGITSHDLVDQTRRKYKTRRVGHAGALDPFAEGLMIILVGRATKLSDQFLGLDKEYEAEILLGIETDSGDPEGKINKIKNEKLKIKNEDLEEALKSFMPSYEQYVPVFSSVKIQGNKLRELARKSDEFRIKNQESGIKIVEFYKDGKVFKEIELPKKMIKINEIELLGINELRVTGYEFKKELLDEVKKIGEDNFQVARVRVACSKGTYIRQLAIDIGEKLEIPAMLVGLKRTKIGEFSLADIAS